MAGNNIDDDEYVANLLKQDAKNSAKHYEMVGLSAFMPQRPTSRAPKPNTQFLRHIIRETDHHNAALLAKEAEESRARLKKMDRGNEKSRRDVGRLTPPDLSYEERRYLKRSALDHHRENGTDTEREERSRDKWHRGSRHHILESKRDRENDRDRRRDKRQQEDTYSKDSRLKSRRLRRHRDKEKHRRHDYDDYRGTSRRGKESHRHKRRRSYSRSISRSRSRSPRSHKHYKPSRRHHPDHQNRTPPPKTQHRASSLVAVFDSDPLEEIMGPLPPPSEPAIRSRGRGAHKANSMAMDARFSTTYDPSTDIHAESDLEDDWGEALERVKDRQRWRQGGAERLRQAGFSDEQIKKWEKGDEKSEEDVVWTAKGVAREWDRGKVVDDEGEVDLKADWGRLK
ncbi:hypothetical protein CC78DRAFT_557192 [Lojkania enalia]|uniref:Pre-mRNA-splicing factor 38B n=1 Tax=Lojkania enalia TaxID=147567 RepID=A0A9P4TR64_9PLEO|nr:hypothetical protein CC78DRAFT_557192 [Didymosphaeria enalia]